MIREGLEEPYDASHPVAAVRINIALDWFEIVGDPIFDCTLWASNYTMAGTLWKGRWAYCPPRLAFWATRLEEITKDDKLDGETRARAARGAKVIRLSLIHI